MPQLRHPLTLSLYDLVAETGEVEVVDRDGRRGRFTADGVWVSGELQSADPELCRWLAGPRLASRHRAAMEAADGAIAAPRTRRGTSANDGAS